MTIEELKHIQIEHDLLDKHIVWTDEVRFAIAHTQDERRQGDKAMNDCLLHRWLGECDGPPIPEGIYVATTAGHWNQGGLGFDYYYRDPWFFESLKITREG